MLKEVTNSWIPAFAGMIQMRGKMSLQRQQLFYVSQGYKTT